MPSIGLSPGVSPSRIGFGSQVGPNAINQATDLSVKQDRDPGLVMAGTQTLGGLDLVDTVASSIPGVSNAIGLKRGDINHAALNAIDMPGLGDFYHDYKGGIEATSGVMGIIASELVARKLTAPAGAFMGLLRTVPYARRIATLDEQYNNALSAVRAIDMNLAARGALGAEQFVGRTVVDHAIFDSATGQFVRSTGELSRKSTVFQAKALGAASNMFHASVTEGVMAITLNQNGFLYDDSAAHNLAWMGLGLATAGGAGWLQGAYSIRKFVNSDEVRRTFANAMDPGGEEESRLLWHGKKVTPDEQVSFLGGVFSDRITNLLVNSRILTDTPHAGTVDTIQLHGNRERLATQWEQLAQEETQKLTRRGISSNGHTRFSMDAPGYGNHLKMSLRRDPAALYGTEQIGGVADDASIRGLHDSHVKRLQERIDETEEKMGGMLDDTGELSEDADPKQFEILQKLSRRLDFESTLTPMAMVDGELMPLSEAEAFHGWKEPEISFRSDESLKPKVKGAVKGSLTGDNHGLWEVRSENPKGNVSLDTGFVYHIPGGKSLDKADQFDLMRMYRLADKAMDQMRRFKGPLVVPNHPDWFQLDMAEELLRRTEGRANVVFPNGMTREQARIEALIQKSRAIKNWDKSEGAKALKEESKGNTYEGQLSKLRLRYNLPKLTAYERGLLADDADHPVMQLLRGMAEIPEDELRKMSLTDVRKSMAEFKRIGDMAPAQTADIEDMGNSFRFMKDENGNPIKPLLLYKRPFKTAEWTSEHTAERLAAAKMWSVAKMTADDAAPMTRIISQSLVSSPDFDAAARTHELLDTQIQGGLWGASPQSQAGALANAFRTSDWRDRDNPILLAATRIRENVSRMTRDAMKTTIQAAFGDSLNLLSNPRNATSKLLLNQFHTFRPGWDIAPVPVKMDNGMFGFVLRPTEDNAERFRTQFGREMTKGQLLLAPSDKPIVLDELGMDLQGKFNQVTTMLLGEKNTILRANGRKEIENLVHYVPSPNTNGKYIGFTFGPDNKPIPSLSVIANTEQEFKELQKGVYKKIEELGPGYTFRTQDSIREFANIWDRVQMDFINPGVTAVQPGKRQSGKLVGQQIRLNAFEDSLKNLQDSFLSHGQDITETLLREQVNAAKARGLISSEATKNQGRAYYDVASRNVYDFYLENLLGKSKLNSKGSFVGRLYRSIEGPIDKYLSESTPGVAKVWNAATEWMGKAQIWSKDEQARKDFDSLSQHLGKYMPFEDATAFAEAKGYGAAPPTLAKIAGGMNRFTAAVVLRMFETIHPVMNLSGIVNAAPAVIRHFTPMRGENAEDFARRVGHSATIFELPNGQSIGTLDMAKLTTRGFKRAWNRTSDVDYDYMVRRGFLSQEVAEFQRQFSAIDSKKGWETFFYGDSRRKGFASKGVVGWTGILSDKSEDFSRSWGHMTGLELADMLGITDMEAKHAFAHDLANKMIANYSPQNRPEIFQGALGAPLGLFQSFMVNYYERLFRYTETADYRALAHQYAAMSGLFGIQSVPGWQQFNALMTDSDGSDDPASSFRRRFGKTTGDLLAHGLLSNLPELFGLPGADLYSRGDVSIRQFQIRDPDSISGILQSTTPAFNVAKKLYDGMRQGIGLFSDSNPHLSTTQVGEVLSNMIANRPLAGWIEQAMAHGNDTDAKGQLVSDTKSSMEMAYRLLGIRSQRQSDELQAFYANKNAQSHQAALKEELSLHTRSLIRAGQYDQLPAVFESYVKQGGDPKNFRRWLKGSYIAATSTRGQRMLEQIAKDPQKMDQVLRLLDAGVTVNDDENTEDTNQLYTVDDPDGEKAQ
jgi:hypothetical protein